MTTIDENYIPSLDCEIEILNFSTDKFLLCLNADNKSKFIVGSEIKYIISQIGSSRSLRDITALFNKEFDSAISIEEFVYIFENRIRGLGILKGDTEERIRQKGKYLKLRYTIIDEKWVRLLSAPISFLFKKQLLNFLSITTILTLSFFYIKNVSFPELYFGFSSSLGLWFIAIYIVSHIFHELGHSAACIRFGASPGSIGIGFYYFRPVFYADVSDVWRLRRSERIIVDLAGIYMQLLFCTVFVCIFIISKDRFFLNMSFLISTTLLFHLNPFFRYDGYWVLTDILNITNLREKSVAVTKSFLDKIFRSDRTWKPTKMNVFLVCYLFLSVSFLFYFVLIVLVYKRDSVVYFPIDLYHFIVDIFTYADHVNFEWVKWNLLSFIIPIAFYSMLYFFVRKWLVSFVKSCVNTKLRFYQFVTRHF